MQKCLEVNILNRDRRIVKKSPLVCRGVNMLHPELHLLPVSDSHHTLLLLLYVHVQFD